MKRKNRVFAIGLALVLTAIQCGGCRGTDTRGTDIEASEIPGTGTLSGEVEAPQTFKAAKVYAMNVDRNMLYMVYTDAGQHYRAVNMLPGNYEVGVQKEGFAGDVKKVLIEPGTNATVDFSLQEAEIEASTISSYGFRSAGENAEILPYDEVYPPGPGREVLERTCITCHGINFPSKLQGPDVFWNAIIDRPDMMDPISSGDRQLLVDYMVENFGPGSTPKAVEVSEETPLDEQALAKAQYIEYYLPLDPELDADNTQRRGVEPHFDHDGNVWFTDTSVPSRISKVDPRTGIIEDYLIADPEAHPHGITVDADGHVWWAETSGFHLGRLDPKTGEMIRYSMADEELPYGWGHTPYLGSDESIWFTIITGNRLGKWDRKTEKITLWEPPTPRSFPYGITQDKDDNIWFLEFHGCKVTKFEPGTEKMTEYPVLHDTSQMCTPRRLGMAPNGKLWFAVPSHGLVSEFDPVTETLIEHPLPIPQPFSEPYATQADKEGNIWISDAGQGGAIIRFDPKTETFTYYPSPQRTDMPKFEITREGAIWYNPRAAVKGAVGVLYPDKDKMTTMGAYY